MNQPTTDPEVLAKARELLVRSRGNNSQDKHDQSIIDEGKPKVAVSDEQLEQFDPHLVPHSDPTKPPPLIIPGLNPNNHKAVANAAEQRNNKEDIKIRRSEQKPQGNNKIELYADEASGAKAIVINNMKHDISEEVYQLFTRMLSQIRDLTGELETERQNIHKLKMQMAANNG